MPYRTTSSLSAALILIAPLVSAQTAPTAPSRSLYAVNSASIASAMTYCMMKYGPLRIGSKGAACFTQARNVLAARGLKQSADKIDQACRDPSAFNTCITPEIGKLVIELNNEFKNRNL